MKMLIVFVASAMLACSGISAFAADLKIIANPDVKVDSVSAEDLKAIFLLNKSSLSDGSHVQPVIEKGGVAHEAFLKEYVGKTDSALQNYYRSLVFTGKGTMPKTCGSDIEVTACVSKTKGAIGYVGADAPTNGVKTLAVK